jgi:hypothetical protein
MMKTRYFIFSALLSQYPLHALAQSLEKERPTLKEVTVIANNPIGDTCKRCRCKNCLRATPLSVNC